MKIAIVGKGGTGKTTISACLARLLGRDGYRVIAVDADPSLNLSIALGVPPEEAAKKPILFDEEEFIKSRTQLSNGLYVMNPKVDDVIERFGIKAPDNVILIRFGEVKRAGSRCLCPEYAFLRALFSHLVLGRKDTVIFDMVAGLEHMSRGTLRGIDLMLCIVEPSLKSIEVAIQMEKFAKELNIKGFSIIANKIRNSKDMELISGIMKKQPIISIPYDEAVIEADKIGVSLLDYSPNSNAVKAISKLKEIIKQNLNISH
jgi:CO dehydrogenase maturation factor